MDIFNNIFIYIFLLIYIFYITLKMMLKRITLKSDDNAINMYLEKIHRYRITNIYFVYFILLFYFCITVLAIILLRSSLLGKTFNISIFDPTLTTLYLQTLPIILCIIYYLKIINIHFYLNIIKLHFYLCYHYEFYNDFCFAMLLNINIISDFFGKFRSFLYLCTLSRKEFVQKYKEKKTFKKRISSQVNHNYYYFAYVIMQLIKNKFILKIMKRFFKFLSDHSSQFSYHIPYTILSLTILFEINTGIFYYIYYVLLYVYIITLIKKIRHFYRVKDPHVDHLIGQYLYNNNVAYENIEKLLLENKEIGYMDLLFMPDDVKEIITNKSEIVTYIINDYKVYYAIDETRSNNDKYLYSNYLRIHLLLVLLLLNLYFIWYNKIILIFFNTIMIQMYFISIPILIILYLIHKKILYFASRDDGVPKWAENKKLKQLFYILLFIYSLPILYLYIKNKITITPSEIILHVDYLLIIKENFTLSEKYNYLSNLYNYFKLKEIYDTDSLEFLISNTKISDLITENMTLHDIRNKIQALLETVDEKQKEGRSILQKIKEYLFNKK